MVEAVEKQENFASMPHVLVVDDDARICALVTRYLSAQGFVVMSAENTAQARALLARFEFDALVVDVMMSGETGLEFTQGLRGDEAFAGLPVLLLTALGEIDDRIEGLEAGADDYLVKPFEPRELVLRLNAILRRTGQGKSDEVKAFRVGRWRYDPVKDMLEDEGEQVKLTAMEANLIKALAKRAGEVLSREELAELCGVAAGSSSHGRTIDVQVTRLRRKIEDDSKAPRYLQTVRGKGYMLRTEPI